VGPPDSTELIGSIGSEAVITSIKWVFIVGGASRHHACIVRVLGNESSLKLTSCDSSVTIGIVPFDPKLDLLVCREDSDLSESFSEFVRGDRAAVWLVKDLESVLKVEIWLASKASLGLFEVIFNLD
jgi:hypothetical protein